MVIGTKSIRGASTRDSQLKKYPIAGVGRGAGGREWGEDNKYYLSKLDNLFFGSPQEQKYVFISRLPTLYSFKNKTQLVNDYGLVMFNCGLLTNNL